MTTDSEYAATVAAIRTGDGAGLRRLLEHDPSIAASRLGGGAKGRTPLHVVTDWPGYFPNGPRIAQLLIDVGANVDARSTDDDGGETPLHWAASSDDVDVARVLIDADADIEIPDGSIGTPLDNAIGYACWHVARLLVDRGATVAKAVACRGARDDRPPRGTPRGAPDDRPGGGLPSLLACLRRWTTPCGGAPAQPRRGPELGTGLCPRDRAGRSPGDGTQRSNVIEWLESRGAGSSESTEGGATVMDDPEQIARRAYAAFAEGDVSSVLELVDSDLEWTFLDPSVPDPEPAVCHGRDQLAYWMGRDSGWRLSAELEEVVANGDRVLVATRSPGIDQRRARSTGDRNFHVLTIRDGKITALRACRDRNEAIGLVTAT